MLTTMIYGLDFEGIVQHAAKAIHGDGPVDYHELSFKITNHFSRVHMWMRSRKLKPKVDSRKHVPVEKHYTEVGIPSMPSFEEYVERNLTQIQPLPMDTL